MIFKKKKYTGSEDCDVGSVLRAITDLLDQASDGNQFQRYINWIAKSILDNWLD